MQCSDPKPKEVSIAAKQAILECLKDLIDLSTTTKLMPVPFGGICCNCLSYLSREYTVEPKTLNTVLYELFVTWEHYSGDLDYPIPGGKGMFCNCNNEDMWNPEHPYGFLRLQLLDHCISDLEKKLSS